MILDLTDHILAISVRELATAGRLWDLHYVHRDGATPPGSSPAHSPDSTRDDNVKPAAPSPHPLVAFLHVLPRSHIPTATKTALAQLPSISLDTAAKLGDTWLLNHMLHRGARHAVDLASAHGHVAALRWLFAHPRSRSLLLLSWTAAAVDNASANGHVDVLEWWLNSGLELKSSNAGMALAARNGHVHVLAWWVRHHASARGVALKCRHILDHAAEAGRVDVLDWCVRHLGALKAGGPVRDTLTNALLLGAVDNGHAGVLRWWDANAHVVGSGKEGRGMQAVTRAAAAKGNLVALQWLKAKGWYVGHQADVFSAAIVAGDLGTVKWVYSRAPLPPPAAKPASGRQRGRMPPSNSSSPWISSSVTASNEPYYLATKHGHTHLLAWLASSTEHRPHAKTNYKTIASAYGFLDVLQWWWAASPATRRLEPMALIRATDAGHTHVLQWWQHTGLLKSGVRLGDGLLDAACAAGHVDVVEWWMVRSRVAVEYDKHVLDDASANGRVNVLDWWIRSGLPLRYSHEAVDAACAAGHVRVLQWWIAQARVGRVELKYTQRAVTGLAMARPDVAALVWKRCGLATMGVSSLTHWGDLQFVDVWRRELGVRVDVHSMAMDWHSGEGNVAELECIVANHEAKVLVYTQAAMSRATAAGHVHVLEWWLRKWKSGKIPKVCVPVDVLGLCKSANVEQWWLESGLL